MAKLVMPKLKIGDSKIMLADEWPELNSKSAKTYGGSPVSLNLYVRNVNKVVEKALSAGAKLIRPVEDMFYGDRAGSIEDLFGHIWHVSTHIEDVSNREIKKRAVRFFEQKKREAESQKDPAFNAA